MALLLTPTDKLFRRIEKEFTKKKLIGDISISDEEFSLLLQHLRNKFYYMYRSGQHQLIDRPLCVALVQIGIRYYDGNYWSHVGKLINSPLFNSNHQGWLGSSYIMTMRQYEKLELGYGSNVTSILMHGFVSNYYSDNFFNFLFAFYRIDLDRDLSRLDRWMMNNLTDAIRRNDKTERTYWLVEQTADAVRNNIRGSKVRIRRYLKLIDKAFWGDDLPVNSNNRLIKQFLRWKDSSDIFQNERNQFSGSSAHSKKSYSSPYLKFSPDSGAFQLVLPPQLLRFQEYTDLYWSITVNGIYKRIYLNPYSDKGITGYKTDECFVTILQKDVLGDISAELSNSGFQVKTFRDIRRDSIRFFDESGYYIRPEMLSQGRVYAFSPLDYTPDSAAMVSSERFGELLCSSFEFLTGDIVLLPDGKTISVGGRPKEGLLPRGILDGAVALLEDEKIPLYSAVPRIIIKTSINHLAGTAVIVNGKKLKIAKNNTLLTGVSEFNLFEHGAEKGYIIDLKYFGCTDNGVYNVHVDIPNEYANRDWKFTFLRGLSYRFEGGPYVFNSRGTLCILRIPELTASQGITSTKNGEYNNYDFEIVPGEPYVRLDYKSLTVCFEIPALSYKFGDGAWQTTPHIDIWHTDFQPKLLIRYPGDRIKVMLDADSDEDPDSHARVFSKIKSKDLFECDLTPFQSWFGRNQTRRQIYIDLMDGTKPVQFLGIITKSVLLTGTLHVDFQKSRLIGEFDIIGKAVYYADLIYNDYIIAEKIPLTDGMLVVESELETGKYDVHVFEAEDDDSGFGEPAYYEIGQKSLDLLNSANLSGKSIAIRTIKPVADASSYLPLHCSYRVEKISLIAKEDRHLYRGKMVVSDSLSIAGQPERVLATFPVQVDFYDLNRINRAYITFFDEDTPTEFLYDEARCRIVKHEEISLSKSQAYRRYKRSLYPEEYVFEIEFIDLENETEDCDDRFYNNMIQQPIKPIISMVTSMKTSMKKSGTPITEMGFSIRTFNALHRAGIDDSDSISRKDFNGLTRIRNLGYNGIQEIIGKMQALGYSSWVNQVTHEWGYHKRGN